MAWVAIVDAVPKGIRRLHRSRGAWRALAIAALACPVPAAAHPLAVGLAGAPTVPALPDKDANALLRAADESLERGDYATAAEGYSASYRALSLEQQRSALGGRTIALAYDAYREAWHRGRSPEPLRAARGLLVEHIAVLDPGGKPAAIQEARHRLEWIEHLLELEEASARAATPVACPEPAPQEPLVCPDPTHGPEGDAGEGSSPEDVAPRRNDPVGVALVAAGAVTLGGGVGLVVGGSRVLPAAQEQVRATGRDPDDPVPQDAAYLQVHEERGRNLMIAGGVVAGLGVAAATWGIVRLVRRRAGGRASAERAVTVIPSPRGILLRARF